MQFADGLDHGPWPHDMLITIEEQPSTLMLLLFVRDAWGLDLNGVPPLEASPSPGATRPPDEMDRDETNGRWAADWARAIEAVSPSSAPIREPDAELKRLLDADLSFDELMEAVSIETYWRAGLDAEAEWAWRRSLEPDRSVGWPSPEHNAVEWLVPVWQSGLRTIIELPFAGYFARRLDREHTLVSRVTRHNPELYSLALSTM